MSRLQLHGKLVWSRYTVLSTDYIPQFTNARAMFKPTSAFLNTDGGNLIVGVSDARATDPRGEIMRRQNIETMTREKDVDALSEVLRDNDASLEVRGRARRMHL